MSLMVNYLFFICCLASIYSSNGCRMEGVTVWQIPITVPIEDYHEGVFLERSISDITGFTVTSYSDLNGGPYVDASIDNSVFVLRTNDAYRLYEEHETSEEMSLTFTFSCTDGTTSLPLTVRITINDNNNNDPLFKTADTPASIDTTYDFTIAPPVPPGFLITDCVRDIIVRDIDLTTYRIDFGIEDNPYVAIEYDEASSTVNKEFKAILRTTTFIRSLPEPIVLRISATDVDRTTDDPITTYTTVTIHGSEEFELPAEPVFTEAFYLANYNDNNELTLEQTISLQQGYDDQVAFSLEGEYAKDHFDIVVTGNQVDLVITNPLTSEVLQQGQIFLIVHATRLYTSGASATVVVQLPAAVELAFQQPLYEGQIVDNTLQLTQLVLSQGYQGSTITVTVEDYPSLFTATAVGNVITLSMTPLDSNLIEENNFMNVRITASTGYSSATTIVTLEIVKDDVGTPVFEKSLYTGTYDPAVGLTLDPLLLVQGYDDTVQITFSGDHQNYFQLDRNGASSTLRVIGDLPSQVLSESHILLSVEAAKPRTVGASTVVSITLPKARELQFEAETYWGSIQDNVLSIEPIILNVGYDADVSFSLSGDYSSSFSLSRVQNQVTIILPAELSPEVISGNNILALTITATGLNALPTTAAVLLDIIKDDATTPVFSKPIYYGTYLGSLNVDIENINLAQGYDSSVAFRIEGENSQYFQLNPNTENSVTLSVRTTIPEEVIFNEKVFVFNIFAEKPLTVGANAAITIKFSQDLTEPTVMQFSENTYIGSLEDNILTLENIVLETGFSAGTEFHLSGDYASYFTTAVSNNLISLSLPSGLSAEITENNKFIVLELEARRERAVSVFTSIVIDLIKETVVTPVFNQAFYSGIYTEEYILKFEETISLLQGYDDTVTLSLEGESSTWFSLVQSGNSATLIASSGVPQDVLDSHHQLLFTVLAHKPNTLSGRSAISIDLPKGILTPELLRFEKSHYEGQIDGSILQLPTITLQNEITGDIVLQLTGDHAAYFSIFYNLSAIYVELLDNLPPELVNSNDFLTVGITASKQDAVSGYTTLVLSIVKEPQIVTPVFERAYYTGGFSDQDGLLFEHTIRLIQGFDDTVSFTLDGDGSEWFILTENEQNSLTLSVVDGGIQEENRNHVIVSVLASKPGSITGEAAIVIHLADNTDSNILGFEKASYVGTVENGVSTMEPIILTEGFSSEVTFTLHGDLVGYFDIVAVGASVSVVAASAIPESALPANNIIVLELRAAAPLAVPAVTAVVFEVVRDDDVTAEELIFSEPYYTGQLNEAGGLVFDHTIALSEGYDSAVQFVLEGDHSQWFALEADGNIARLVLSAAVPPAVIANNQQLVFLVKAERPNSNSATATIVISLVDDYTDANILGFERASYVGTIKDSVTNIEPIMLTEGFTSEVTFTIHGDLASYFDIVAVEASVSVVAASAIPESALPANNIIVLELRAAAPLAVPAVTAVVFEVVRDDDVTAEELIFSEPYYTGQLSEAGGLVFDHSISLSEGYDSAVQFALEGDHSQWFALEADGNVVRLVLSAAVPPAVIANNQQLVFLVKAERPNSNSATATIVISLVDDYTDANILGFERASYVGTIEDSVTNIEPIMLTEGFTSEVIFTLHGDLASYFDIVAVGASVSVVAASAIPESDLPANNIIVLELRAAAPLAVPAVTAVVFEVVRDDDVTAEELTFSEPYYSGQFSEAGGLVFDHTISLSEGYDSAVQFVLEGDQSQWFALEADGNIVRLVLSIAVPPAVIANNQQLVFLVKAERPNSNSATATIVISLVDDYTDANILGFERASYVGTIEDGEINIDSIVLTEGFSSEVTFTLHGDLASYFDIVAVGASVSVVAASAIPESALPANNIIVLELRAAAPLAVPAVTAVVFEVVRDDDVTAEELIFSEPYYTGQLSEAGGLVFDHSISLSEGYDSAVQFALEGDHSQWFALEADGNVARLVLSAAVPPAVIANNQQLVFLVKAERPNSNSATATIVISLVDDYTDANILGFERASYVGTIEDSVTNIEPIMLTEGFTSEVIFTLHGDLASYFDIVAVGASVSVVAASAIPESDLPANNIIVLELRAAAPLAVPAVTAVVFEVVRDDDVTAEELIFSEPYYTGQLNEAGGLVFDHTIALSEGYDSAVQFVLEGDHSQWFALEADGNIARLVLSAAVPPAVIANNQQLVFLVKAERPNSNSATATIVISLVDDYTDANILGFERASYVGTIKDSVTNIEPIMLTEGFTSEVTFTIHGDLASYFDIVAVEASVSVVAASAIPESALPANNIIVLELRAAAPLAVPAVTAVVFEVVRDDDVTAEELIFSEPYYTGQLSEAGGLVFDHSISLSEGYDSAVQFALEGDHSQWFALEADGNVVRLVLSAAVPPAVIANNQQLVFLVKAERPNSNSATATIVISLVDDYTDANILGFERASYVGTIEDSVTNIEPIMLTEGFTSEVIFTLHGDLASYFDIVAVGASVSVVAASAIPESDLPANNIIVLELRAAAPLAVPAVTAVVFEVVRDDDVTAEELTFSEPYYSGQFSEAGGLVFDHTISLSEGYDSAVQFVLEGDQSQWFALEADGNIVRLVLSIAVPPAVIANNQQLVFLVKAERPNSNSATATIVISLVDDYTDANILGFERASYVGTIEDGEINIDSIVLTEGFSSEVTFTLHGDLASYFDIVAVGASVSVVAASAIPESALPANNIIVLELRAAAPLAVPAVTAVVFEVVRDDDVTAEELIFSEPYYTGQLSEAGGLVFDHSISLSEGYDSAVQFALEGDHSQWFALEADGNVARLVLSAAVPPAVIANNQQLVFLVKAERPNSNSATATIVISLVDDYTDANILGFERASYVGTIEDSVTNIEPIMLTEGFTSEVIFTLHGDLASYFDIVAVGASVSVVAASAIPESDLPANNIIVLELRAAAPLAVPAVTAVVFEVVRDDDVTAEELIFSEPYYTGQLNEAGGLVFDHTIALSEGYDSAVQFVLEGDHSQWFALEADGNIARLVLSAAVPPAVIANNQQLVFLVKAERPNSNSATATIVISLVDDYTDANILGFERASYVGTIKDSVTNIEPIMLTEGFTSEVTFTIHGDLASYFDIVAVEASVSVVAASAIPESALPANNIIVLELRAAAPLAVPAVTAVVFEVVRDDDVTAEELIFSEPYYTGQLSEAGGLVFDHSISLSEGYDSAVQFALEGDHSQWFALEADGNVVRLVLSAAVPPAVIANNQQLVFLVKAERPNSNSATATIVISLVDDYTDANILGFERASYVGTIEDSVTNIEPIMLTEGFTSEVIFTLHGDLASYFDIVAVGASVSVVAASAIPESDLPANNIIVLELRAAAPLAVPAVTAVVFEVVRDDDVTAEELTFSEPYYSGQFSEAGGLVFDHTISLSEGYDSAVQFVLEGDQSQWFALEADGNIVRLVLSIAVPPAVIANNQQLVFLVKAERPNSNSATATIVISLVDDYTDANILGFERASYVGTIEDGEINIDSIVLTEGFSSEVTFTLHGDLASYFDIVAVGASVSVVAASAIPESALPANNIIVLELRAAAPLAVPAVTAVVFEVVRDDDVTAEELIFSEPYYTGQLSEAGGLVFDHSISLSEGYDSAVQFALEGDHSRWFALEADGNIARLVLSAAVPPVVIANNQQLVFLVKAERPNSNSATATIVISLVDDYTDANILGFERASYVGTIEDGEINIDSIVLTEGFSSEVTFTLHGDLASYFDIVAVGASVSVVAASTIPESALPANNIIVLELRAAAPLAVPAVTAVVFEVVRDDDVTAEELTFSEPYYSGQLSEAGGLVFDHTISLSEGYDSAVQFVLEGDQSQWFALEVDGNIVRLVLSAAVPPAVIANNQQLVFLVKAERPNSNSATATIVISLVDDYTDANILGFERASYVGTIEDGEINIDSIVLNEGFSSEVTFTLHGDLASYFDIVAVGASVSVVAASAIPESALPANNIIVLELRAAAPLAVPAVTAVVFEVVRDDDVTAEELIFSEPYYTGQLSEAGGLVFDHSISLSEGYDSAVQFALEGDHAQWFALDIDGNVARLVLSGAVPPAVIANNRHLVFVVMAQRPNSNAARATIVISLIDGSGAETNVAFEKVLYEGILNLDAVQHEPITITGYDGNEVEILGDYNHLFSASASAGEVTVVSAGSVILPQDVTFVPLQLRAGGAGAVLLLNVKQGETPELPSVVFGSPSYVLRTDISYTGLVGRVSAVASNGETVAYSLAVHNAHLQERVSVNGDGEIHLSAPTNTGVYSFQVIATSIITQVQATATVQLTVDATATCGEDDRVLPPLIILDRDEEEPHENLVVLDSETYPGCEFRLTNRWPIEHDWLYVDENGLHARAIDREDPRIAFMALSQVQVEIILECPSDSQTRTKRSVNNANTNSRLDWLGPYDYGSNKWILTDTISYNSRRSFVNLIVNDINDNDPIFIGKENDPIVVGYPIPELEEIVLPRALAELKATDADVGENAALRYWSDEDVLAVAPATGSVHVRDDARLVEDSLLTISVTDLNGANDGRTTTIQLLVKLLDVRHIAVVTVRNAFLDQEVDILNNLTAAVGYEVKVLSSAVISDDTEVDSDSSNTRNKREVTSEGASLQLHVYGVIDRDPVAVDKLSEDITTNVVAGVEVTRTISLEDHLDGREIPAGRDIALLVSTIVLSVLLFILIVVIAVWFFLRWRKAQNYEQFSDANSVASRNEPLEPPPKVDSLTKPRLGLEELKKSERRLQEMLDAPVEETAVVKPSTSTVDTEETFDTIINMAPPDTTLPIVIQSIDRLKDDVNSGDEDEFGERITKNRRKSVVTFNENVEKIIHVEDIPDDNSSDVEVFRF